MKKILITSGGTREYVDDVRVLTNISTGKLGAKIAEKFYWSEDEDYEIHYIAPNSAEKLRSMIDDKLLLKDNYHYHEITDVESVYDKMKELVPEMDIVIHSMAVSDFGFKNCSTKLKSNDIMMFIESLKERIYQTPKILSEIKTWNPNCKLISFKFEVGLSHEDLIKIAIESGLKNNSDLVIANDKAEMVKESIHKAYALDPKTKKEDVLNDKSQIANYIYNWINCK